jgi:hypothetical protein
VWKKIKKREKSASVLPWGPIKMITPMHFFCQFVQCKLPNIVLIFFLGLFTQSLLFAQDTLNHANNKKLVNIIDTLLIDKDLSHWSVRAVASYKDNRFNLSNSKSTMQYTPNNRVGIGVGIATSKLVADLVLNLKKDKEEQTERFDFQGNLLIKQNVIILQVQNYQGYNVRNTTTDDPGIFRKDIRSFSTTLSFMHLFNAEIKTPTSIYSGINRDFKSSGSFLVGIYTSYHIINSDSSIVPESSKIFFNEEAYIEGLNQFSIGGVGGYSYFLALPKNFFILLTLTPGLGINFKSIKAETINYTPKELWELYLYMNISIGYNGSRFYIELSDENLWNFSPLGNGNKGLMNATNFKLAFGWKIATKRNH